MRNRRSPTAIILLVGLLSAGCNNWRGPGFHASGPEMPRLRQVLALKPGISVADVGAGKGEVTVALAAEVGPSGHVFSTEIDTEALEQIRAVVAAATLENVTVVRAHARETGLPSSCCDAILLRRVYHHLTDPAAINTSLLRALRPGGLLAVIDFPPTLSWLWPWPPRGVPRNRGGHGVEARLVIEEVTASGFELVQVIDDWPGRSPLTSYCAVFRRPRDGHLSHRNLPTDHAEDLKDDGTEGPWRAGAAGHGSRGPGEPRALQGEACGKMARGVRTRSMETTRVKSGSVFPILGQSANRRM